MGTAVTSSAPVLVRALALVLAATSFRATGAEKKQWEQLTQCRYVPSKYNDGDSFRVKCGDKEFPLRLYYVDAPESNLTDAARVGEQRSYFKVTIEDVLSAGEKAAERVKTLLEEPFAVSTRWAVAGGRSKEARYYGLVDARGKRLVEVLLSEGLARTKGVVVTMPKGEKATDYLARLRGLEREAHNQRIGIWAHSRE